MVESGSAMEASLAEKEEGGNEERHSGAFPTSPNALVTRRTKSSSVDRAPDQPK